MALKAKLKVQLFAGETMVAESDDEKLWQVVLNAISTGDAISIGGQARDEASGNKEEVRKPEGASSENPQPKGAVDKFAMELGVSREELIAACSPSTDAPYIHLDHHCWEALKKNTPQRGAGAVASIVLSATLLALWVKHASLEAPSNSDAQNVLKSINLNDKNPVRGIKKCEWLQSRNGKISLNPARVSKAIEVAKAYCLQKSISGSD